MSEVTSVYTEALGRSVLLREGTSDRQVWADTFTGRYHLPPPEMAEPAMVLDLGANIGLTAAHYQTLWPAAAVFGIEPSRANMTIAVLNTSATMQQLAVCGWNGPGWFNPRLLAEAFQVRTDYRNGDDPVECVTLAKLIQLIGRDVDFCKMDVESAEWGIFESPGWAPLVRHLLVELHPREDMPDDSAWLVAKALAALADLGYNARPHQAHPRAIWAWR